VRLEEITRLAALEALVPEWSALFERAPTAAPFLSPHWLLPWWHHLGGGELWVLALREDAGDLAAVLPLFVYLREGQRVLALLGSGISDELDLLAEPGRGPAAAAVVLEHLARSPERWHAVEPRHLPAESPLVGERCPPLRVEPGEDCQVLELPASVEEFRSRLRPHHRRNLRRARTLYIAGFDAELAQASPGTLLTATAIEESIREGARSYDFLRGNEGHKSTWGARPRPRCRLVLG
jgi:CelD/BcsL family acetyltransferase involved in cellulose biosynthesis